MTVSQSRRTRHMIPGDLFLSCIIDCSHEAAIEWNAILTSTKGNQAYVSHGDNAKVIRGSRQGRVYKKV